MKFSKKFKNILLDLKKELTHLALPFTSTYREDNIFSNLIFNCLFNPTINLTVEKFYEYKDLRVAYSFYDNQDIYFIIYRNPHTHIYCIILAYRNQKSLFEVEKRFFINDLYFNYDSFFSSVCAKNDFHIVEDVLRFFKDFRIVV